MSVTSIEREELLESLCEELFLARSPFGFEGQARELVWGGLVDLLDQELGTRVPEQGCQVRTLEIFEIGSAGFGFGFEGFEVEFSLKYFCCIDRVKFSGKCDEFLLLLSESAWLNIFLLPFGDLLSETVDILVFGRALFSSLELLSERLEDLVVAGFIELVYGSEMKPVCVLFEHTELGIHIFLDVADL